MYTISYRVHVYIITRVARVHENGGSNKSLLKIIKQLHQPVKQPDILATLRLPVSCTGLQNYTIGASLLGIRIRIPKSISPM